MRTIKITDTYYVRVTKQNYIVYKLTIRQNGAKVFQSPTYHTKFDSALRDVYNRTVKDRLLEDDVKTLKDSIDVIDGIYKKFTEEIIRGDSWLDEKAYEEVIIDDTPEEDDEDIDSQEVEDK